MVEQYLHALVHVGLPSFFKDRLRSGQPRLSEEVGWLDDTKKELLVLFSSALNQKKFYNALQMAARTLSPIFGNGARVK
ncbi:MAG: hypothetical protein WAP74_02025 [Patescibacteria group bacterium]